MKLRGYDDGMVDLRLDLEEVVLLRNVLREVCHGFDLTERDFHRIVGFPRGEATHLLMRIGTALERVGIPATE